MTKEMTRMEQELSKLKQYRDEIGLQIHLGAAEVKEEFEKAKEKLDKLLTDFEPLKDAVGESAGNVFASLKLVGEEVLQSFKRIRESLK